MSFQVHAKDLLGRIGTLRTKSGAFTTPHMFPVLDPNRQTIEPEFFEEVGIDAVMTNAYLLKRGQRTPTVTDVHDLLGFKQTVATDSGAYQILEFGKVGVEPKEIVEFQERINTDIGVILDVPTGFRSDPSRARWTVDETIRRADQALKAITRKDTLWVGPVQGGVHLKEVKRSATEMAKRNFPIYALGSPTELMESQRYDVLMEMILAAKQQLPADKPLHLFGAGHPVLFPFLVALGCDLFDSAAYALYARAGRYLTPEGTMLLGDMAEFACTCPACVDTTPSKVMRADLGERELRVAKHNLWTCFSELRRIREAIRKGRLWDLLELRSGASPALRDCFARIGNHSSMIEKQSPSVNSHGIFYQGPTSDYRPEMRRYQDRVEGSMATRKGLVLLLPGRWRRPFHEDPRYGIIARSFHDHSNVSICYYSIAFGPVPIELDETFPIAQTESRDSVEPEAYESKAKRVVQFVGNLRPLHVVIVEEEEYGKRVVSQALKVFGKRRVSVLAGAKLKPLAMIRMIEKTAVRMV
ncbi:MAG TPA: tRNA guanosine(15) transglycosylase TgtA [Candidatus Bathyarchaeia archaeon]|nr:tRNA guanosine(15) transglycosylase TgtA [Candidatus Bathyarchaeia archaeon]